MEIERRFLVKRLPEGFHLLKGEEILQGYLGITGDGKVIRLRHKGGRFFLTVKTGEGLTRDETEIVLSHEQYECLWPLTERLRIGKTRYPMDYEGLTLEIDCFYDALSALVVAEVEFPSEEAARSFASPEWLGAEVTPYTEFSNFMLASRGLPDSGLLKSVCIFRQAASLPYRFRKKDTEILLVTNTGGDRWVLPKGLVEEGSDSKTTAETEAYEEAGIRGWLPSRPFFSYAYNKWEGICSVSVYRMRVDEILNKWPEAAARERRWFTIGEAEKKMDERVPRSLFTHLRTCPDGEQVRQPVVS